MRSAGTTLAIAAIAVAAAGCGKEPVQKWQEGWAPIDRKTIGVLNEMKAASKAARATGASQLESQYRGLASDFGSLGRQLKGLKPPGGVRPEQDTLIKRFDEARSASEDVASAAKKGAGPARKAVKSDADPAERKLSKALQDLEKDADRLAN